MRVVFSIKTQLERGTVAFVELRVIGSLSVPESLHLKHLSNVRRGASTKDCGPWNRSANSSLRRRAAGFSRCGGRTPWPVGEFIGARAGHLGPTQPQRPALKHSTVNQANSGLVKVLAPAVPSAIRLCVDRSRRPISLSLPRGSR